jgi:dTDP-4-dehydrorhamnose 3,5-epimerase
MIKFSETFLKGHFIAELSPVTDQRGLFERLFCKKEFSRIGLFPEIAQINHSVSSKKGTFRGLHFQLPPYDEMKIIKCLKGSVHDIAVDLRRESPTFLKWNATELTADNNVIVIIPAGYAHGFQTLSDNAELLYLHTGYYNPEMEGAINYHDPLIKLSLPSEITEISTRDKNHPFIKDPVKELPYFKY